MGHEERRERREESVIGLAMSLRALTHINATRNIIELIASMEKIGAGAFFDPPFHAESWIAFEAAWIRLIIQVIEAFPQKIFSIRPHPLEDKDLYKILERYSNVRVSSAGSMVDWLDEIEVMITVLSTSQLDAYLRGVAVISLYELLPKEIVSSLPKAQLTGLDDHFPNPRTFDELEIFLVRKWERIDYFDKFAKDVFSFPSRNRPSENICKYLETVISTLSKRPTGGICEVSKVSFVPRGLRRDLWLLGYHEIRALFSKNNITESSFSPFRIFRIFKKRRIATRIMSSDSRRWDDSNKQSLL